MQSGNGSAPNRQAALINYDEAKYAALFKLVIATQEDRLLRGCQAQTFHPDMQYASPSSPLAVLVLILGDIVINAQEDVVIKNNGDSNNSLALTFFITQILELYSLYLAAAQHEEQLHTCDWFAMFVKHDPDKAEALLASMLITADNITIDELNISQMKMAAKWFSRFYASIVGRYNIQDTAHLKRAKKNIAAAAGLKQVADTLNRKVSLACLGEAVKHVTESEESLLVLAHKIRIATAPNTARVSLISDLPLDVIITVLKSILLTLNQHGNDRIVSLLLQALSSLPLKGSNENLVNQLCRNLRTVVKHLHPLEAGTLGRMQATWKHWHELQLWLMGMAECIKLINIEIHPDLLEAFTTLHLTVNYIDDAITEYYAGKSLPPELCLVGDRLAVMDELANLLRFYKNLQLQVPHDVDHDNSMLAVDDGIEKTICVLKLWRKLLGEFVDICEDQAACHAKVRVNSVTSLESARKLELPEQFANFMTAQHTILNVLKHIKLTDETLIHWAALAARLRVLTFSRAAEHALGHQLRSLYTVIAIALQRQVLAYQACRQAQHSPLLSHHLHAEKDTACDNPEFAECYLDFELMADPVICLLDGRSYSPEVLVWLNKHRTAPMNRQALAADKCPTEVLFPNPTLKVLIEKYRALDADGMKAAVVCRLTRKPMLDAAFCWLDNCTYSRKAFVEYVETNGVTPGKHPVQLNDGMTAKDFLCDDYNIQGAVVHLYPDLRPEMEAAKPVVSTESGCCRIL